MGETEHPALVFSNASIRTTVDLRVYRLSAVKKTAYRFADRCTAILGVHEGEQIPLAFMFKPGATEATAREVVRAFFQELLDQELREEIALETSPIRALILAQAFSKTDLIRR